MKSALGVDVEEYQRAFEHGRVSSQRALVNSWLSHGAGSSVTIADPPGLRLTVVEEIARIIVAAGEFDEEGHDSCVF